MGLCWLLTSLPTIIDRESHLGLFLLEKAMKFKNVEGFFVYPTESGKIAIKQYSHEHGKNVEIYLTLEQFGKLETWVLRNQDEIECAWNDGVEE